ncbi:MAG TPA: N-acetylmuramoyl-L-alanine amidase [Bauldia sp.]|nr:N-acetylmuramoyl-L-alanine amidase [Bauldia sp.]
MALAIEHRPSPNHGERAAGKPVDILLLHYTGMISDERALKWLCDPESAVSSHYFVFEDGRVAQLVDESRRAWHAGQSFWAGETDINSRSIGVEVANPGHEFGYRPFPDVQIAAVIALCGDILRRHAIPPERVLAHSDVAPERKDDPGELFPWATLSKAGIGVAPVAKTINGAETLRFGERGDRIATYRSKLASYGYGIDVGSEFDAAAVTVTKAFQRHFRPSQVDGVADPGTVAVLDALLAMRQN